MTIFQKNLRLLRLSRKMTQEDLGISSGLSAAVISHYECGQREPNLASLRALKEALDCEYEEFFKTWKTKEPKD
jgi:transcriptional regulator with XRE-family HTH domain